MQRPKKNIKKIRIIATRCVIAFLILILLFIAGVQIYFHLNKPKLLQQLTVQLNQRLHGQVHIDDAKLNVIRYFPDFAITFKNISLRDSVYHRAALSIHKLFIRVPVAQLIRGKININEVLVDGGGLYLFTDSTGYNNRYLFLRKNTIAAGNNNNTSYFFQRLRVQNFSCIITNKPADKNFDFQIQNMILQVENSSANYRKYHISSEVKVKQLSFNLAKGSYLQGATVQGNYTFVHQKNKGLISIAPATILIDKHPFSIALNIDQLPSPHFVLKISSQQAHFNQIKKYLPANIQLVLSKFSLQKPVTVQAVISGQPVQGQDPEIKINASTTHNIYTGITGTLNDVSFTGIFFNHVDTAAIPGDSNTLIMLTHIKGLYGSLPVNADTLTVNNLAAPDIHTYVKSQFQLSQFQSLIGDKLFALQSGAGTGALDIEVQLKKNNISNLILRGNVSLHDGTLRYNPKNLLLQNVKGNIVFNGKDLALQNFTIRLGHTTVQLQGSAQSLLQLITTHPERASFQWKFYSPLLHLQDIIPFFTKRQETVIAVQKKYPLAQAVKTINSWLDKCDINLQGKVDALQYHHFKATDINAQLQMGNNSVTLQRLTFNHADGKLNLQGNLQQSGNDHTGGIKVKMNGLNIAKLFSAFDDFNLPTLHANNLEGTLDANAALNITLDKNFKIIPADTKGQITVDLKNGVLKNFQPLVKLSNNLFKKRDLDSISFAPLKETFYINGKDISFKDMIIHSSAISFFASGQYSFTNGKTNILLQIPLKVLGTGVKDWRNADSLFKKNGLNIFIRAKDDPFGQIHFSFVRLGKERKPE